MITSKELMKMVNNRSPEEALKHVKEKEPPGPWLRLRLAARGSLPWFLPPSPPSHPLGCMAFA